MPTIEPVRSSIERELGDQINALISATRALSEQSAAAFHPDLQPAAFHIARWLHVFGPARPSVIAAGVHTDRSSTSAQIARLRSHELVESQRSTIDGRAIVVHLTPEGRARVESTLHTRGVEFAARTAAWPDEDLVTLSRLLARLVGAEPVDTEAEE